MRTRLLFCFLVSASFFLLGADKRADFAPLFPEDGIPKGWSVRAWDDVKNNGPEGAVWKVQDGILHGSEPRGTWLVSEKLYSDFVLDFEWKLGTRGNSGCGIRFPDAGDPAFDGIEVQMVDPRYYPPEYAFEPAELTGGLYKALPPRAQVFKPTEWNRYEITCRGSRLKVVLNGKVLQDVDLARETRAVERGAPLAARPRRGHIGFQELSRGGGHVQIRNARLKEL